MTHARTHARTHAQQPSCLMRAILVSPEQLTLAAIRSLLTRRRWSVFEAASVSEACARLDGVDLVVVEIDCEPHGVLALLDALVPHRPFVGAIALTRHAYEEPAIAIGSRLGVLVLGLPIDEPHAAAHVDIELAILQLVRCRSAVGLDATGLRGRLRNVLHALRETDGKKGPAAARLGMGRTTLLGFIQTCGITPRDWRP